MFLDSVLMLKFNLFNQKHETYHIKEQFIESLTKNKNVMAI